MEQQEAQGQLPGYELFFSPLQVVLNPTEYEEVQFAYFVSKYGHTKQTRDSGGRYFDHPKAAAWIYIRELGGRDPRMVTIILLHDLSEDAYLLSPYRISRNFGEVIALDVRALTKLPKGKETTKEYLGRIVAQGPYTIIAKLCDRLHNLRTLAGCPRKKRESQVAETEEYHLKLLISELHEAGAPWSIYARPLEEKILRAIESIKATL